MPVTWRTTSLLDGLRRQLDTIVDAQTRDLVRAWAEAWNEVEPDLRTALLEQMVAGERVSRAQLLRSTRLRYALTVIADRLEKLAHESGVRITADLQEVIDTAGAAQAAVIDSQLPPGSHLLGGLNSWARVDARQIEAIVARVTQHITARTRPISAETYRAIRAELVRGIAAGTSPRHTADRMLRRTQQRFTGGLTRALVISRTETLDAHRAAAAAGQAQHADVLTGWVWLTRLDARVCRACLGMAGEEFPLTELGPHGHQQCRCVRMPKTKSWAELGFDVEEPPDATPDAEAWFASLAPSEQRQILGVRGYQAWLAGDFPREQWARRRETDGWRDSYVPAAAPPTRGGSHSSGGGGGRDMPPVPSEPVDGGRHNLGDTLVTKFLADPEAITAVRDATDAINRVHGVNNQMPSLALLEFAEQPDRGGGQRLGAYSFEKGDSDPGDPRGRFGNSVAMSINTLDQTKVATLVHELGHFLDHKGLGDDTASFASATDPALEQWRQAVQGSTAFRTMLEMLTRPEDQEWSSYTHPDGRTVAWNPDADHVTYLMDPREVFARAYTQWIGLRSGNADLVRATHPGRMSPGIGWQLTWGRPAGYPDQWDDADFTAIAEAFDRLFDSLGLLRRQR